MIVDDEREAYVGVDVLTPPPASSVHLDKCSICVKKGRHTWAFNGWMTSEDKASFNTACNVDHADVQKLWARLQVMDCPVANKGLGPKGTTKAQIANQKWVLEERLKQVLATGSLSIGLSTKLSQSCSFMSIGLSTKVSRPQPAGSSRGACTRQSRQSASGHKVVTSFQ